MMDVTLDDGNEQYGVSIAAKCDIGVGQVKKKLAVLSLDPETKGYVFKMSCFTKSDMAIILSECFRTNGVSKRKNSFFFPFHTFNG